MIERSLTAVGTSIGTTVIPDGYTLVRIDAPATLTTNPQTITMKVNTRRGGAMKTSNASGDFSLSMTQNKSYYIDPKYTLGAAEVELTAGSSETGKEFLLAFERIT